MTVTELWRGPICTYLDEGAYHRLYILLSGVPMTTLQGTEYPQPNFAVYDKEGILIVFTIWNEK